MSIFSLIIAGKIPCFKLYESETAIAFLDINPLSRGHCLVVPKHTAIKVHELPDNVMAGVSIALSIVSKAVMDVVGCTDFNIVANNGKTAGQEVMHVHFHIIPKPNKKEGFGFKLTDTQKAKLSNVQRHVLSGGKPSFESGLAYAFLNDDSRHALVIPKHYSERTDQLPEDVMVGVGASLLAATKAISKGCADYNILQCNGSIAGQIGRFMQFHIIARPTKKEGLKVTWKTQKGDMGKLKILGTTIASQVEKISSIKGVDFTKFSRRADEAEHRIEILTETLSILAQGKSPKILNKKNEAPNKKINAMLAICEKLCKEENTCKSTLGWPGVHWIRETEKRLKSSSGPMETIKKTLVNAGPGIARAFAYIEKELGEKKKDAGELKVAYWAIRGLAAALRMTCEYSGAKWTPVNYVAGDQSSPTYKDCWLKNAKKGIKAKNPLANLPYIEDGNVVICQTNACLAYLGKKFNLCGRNLSEEVKVNQCLDQVMDLRNIMVQCFYSPTFFEKAKDTFVSKHASAHLDKMENWLTSNNTIYCASDTPSVADFHLWELIDQLEMFVKEHKQESPLKGRPKLEALYSKIKKLEQLSNYFNGDMYSFPVNNPHSLWK